MVVKLSGPFLQEVLISYHAPHHGRPAAERMAFWDRLTELSQKYRQTMDFSDSNAKVGTVCSEYIGDKALSAVEDPNGEELHTYSSTFGLYHGNTLHDHDAPHTYMSTKGHSKRIDYVALSATWAKAVTSVSTVHDVDRLSTHEDHSMVTVTPEASK